MSMSMAFVCIILCGVIYTTEGQLGIQENIHDILRKNGVLCNSDDTNSVVNCILTDFISVGIDNIVQNCTLNCTYIYKLFNCVNKAEMSADCVRTIPHLIDNIFVIVREVLASLGTSYVEHLKGLECLYDTKVLTECPDHDRLIRPVWTDWGNVSCVNNVNTYRRACVNADDVTMKRDGCQGSNVKTTDTCKTATNRGGLHSVTKFAILFAIILTLISQKYLIK